MTPVTAVLAQIAMAQPNSAYIACSMALPWRCIGQSGQSQLLARVRGWVLAL